MDRGKGRRTLRGFGRRSAVSRALLLAWILLLPGAGTGLGSALAASLPVAHPTGSNVATGPSRIVSPNTATPAVALPLAHRFVDTTLQPAPLSSVDSAAGLAYAPWNNSYYIAAPSSSPSSPATVDIVTAGQYAINATVSVSVAPFGVAVDPGAQDAFVTLPSANQVAVIHGAKVVAEISVGARPQGLAYDAANGTLFVANNASSNVSVIDVASLSVIADLAVGSGPSAVAWDARTDSILVTNGLGENVTVINATSSSLRVSASISVGSHPDGVAIDNLTPGSEAFVANSGSNNVSVINVTCGCAVDAIPVVGTSTFLQGVAYDPLHDAIWVAGGYYYAVVINVTTLSVEDYILVDPSDVVFNPDNGDVCFTNSVNATFTCTTFPPASDYVVRTITFAESGLPAEDPWTVSLGYPYDSSWVTAQTSVSDQLTFWVPVWTVGLSRGSFNFTYSIVASDGYATYPSSGYIASATAANTSVSYDFSRVQVYPVYFNETGLPAGSVWTVDIGGTTLSTTTSEIVTEEPNGSYAYAVATSTTGGWSASPSTGNLTVAGAAASALIRWTNAGYDLAFDEEGLPNGTTWQVTIDGGRTSSTRAPSPIEFLLANGTYGYSVARLSDWVTSGSNGSVTLTGSVVSVEVAWVQIVTYAVTFVESGLLGNGTLWNATLPGSVTSSTDLGSTATSLTFSEPNGTYWYDIPAIVQYGVTEYTANPASGNITVNGAAVTVRIAFQLEPWFFPVTFTETGLADGTGWGIGLAGIGLHSTSASIVTPQLNGSYSYTVGGVAGYAPSPSGGTFTVRGGALFVNVSFSLASGYYAVTFTESGLGPGTLWSVYLNGSTTSSTTSHIMVAEPNGSYRYSVDPILGYTDSPKSGWANISGASPSPIAIVFLSTDLFSITFRESGLPAGAGWAVSIGDELESALTSEVVLREPNGTYGYLVLPVSGFVTNDSGFVTVKGENATVLIAFSPASYPVVIIEFGLANGTSWSVTISNTSTGFNKTYTTTASALILYLPNGTYSIGVTAGGYSVDLSTPTFTVLGGVVGGSPTARFSRGGGGAGAPSSATEAEIALVAVGATAGVGIALVGVSARRRRSDRREGGTWLEELERSQDPVDLDRRG